MVEASYIAFESDLDSPSVGPLWSELLDGLENFLVFWDIKTDERKIAALLHYAGQGVNAIYKTLKTNPPGENNAVVVDKFEDVKRKLSTYFNPKRNRFFEVNKFRQAVQLDGESLDTYVTRLRGLAQHCEFKDTNSEIISQIIEGGSSKDLTAKALRSGAELTLDALLDWGRTREVANQQCKNIAESRASSEVNAVQQAPRQADQKGQSRSFSKTSCDYCGLKLPHQFDCPAKEKSCLACGKANHFAGVCRS